MPRQVESPNEARGYGTGEIIVIDVIFSHDVVLDGEPTLTLETGIFNHEVSPRKIYLNIRIFI